MNRPLPPLPPMRLSGRAQAGLVALRAFLGVITAMAVYTFLHGLTG